jgi:hypothetical protein
MDNKKLMQILLRDAGELEQLIGEIREAGSFDPLDMELLQTRVSGIKHLLGIACELKDAQAVSVNSHDKPAPPPVSVPEAKIESVPAPVFPPEIPKKTKEKKNETVNPVAENLTLPVQPDTQIDITTTEVTFRQEFSSPASVPGMEEDSVHFSEKHILAEKFVAGKSLNDLLHEKSKADPKFSNLPLSSLANGIGTNERFLFTRELFEGNMEHFNETIHTLDNMHTIQEAIDFLSDHFKWGKSETSLRFIELIKRRFIR